MAAIPRQARVARRRCSRALACAWVAAAAAAASPALAAAGRTAALTRATGSGADKAAAQVGHAVRAWLDASDGHESIELATVLGNPDRQRASQAREAAEELTQRGRAAYEALDLDGAVQSLGAALTRYERLAAYLDDVKKVAELLMLLGATHILRGEETLGIRRLEQAVSILPEVEPDPRVFNPAMRKIFNERVVGQAARPTGRVTVTSSPSYAEVVVDGRFRGISPLTLEGLGEGHHFLRLRRDGMRPWGKTLTIVGGGQGTESALLRPSVQADAFEAQLDQVVRRLPKPGREDGNRLADAAVGKLAELCHADELLITQVRLNGERVVVWAYLISASDQKLVKSVEHIFAYDSAPATYEREVSTFLEHDMGIGQAAPVDVVTAQEETRGGKKERRAADDAGLTHAGQARCFLDSDCTTFKKVVVGLGLGLGGGAVGAGVLLYKFANDAHADFQVTPQVDPKSQQLESRGKGLALGGDILVGVGIGLAVAGAVTWWLWDPEPSAGDVIDPPARRARLHIAPRGDGLALGVDGHF